MGSSTVNLRMCVEAFEQMEHAERQATVRYLADRYCVFVGRCDAKQPWSRFSNPDDCILVAGHQGSHRGAEGATWHDAHTPTESEQ